MRTVGRDALAGRRILIVEDEYFLAHDIGQAVLNLGAEIVGPAPTLSIALDILGSPDRLDAAILDVNLRGEMCYQVADLLIGRGIPFVFATGYDRVVVPDEYRSVPHWQKPFDADALARALPELMGG